MVPHLEKGVSPMASNETYIDVVELKTKERYFRFNGMMFPWFDRSVVWTDGRRGVMHAREHPPGYKLPFDKNREPHLLAWIQAERDRKDLL